MPRFAAESLERITRRILLAAGTPPHIADRVAAILVNANLCGHDSHGVLRIPAYVEQIEKGVLRPAEEPRVLRDSPAALLVDGCHGWGHYVAERATDLAVERAAGTGSVTVALTRCHHIGRLGEYVERAARAGFLSILAVGYGGRGVGCAAPLGGAERALGTNPFAFGAPTGTDVPFVADFATTVVAEGKLQVARSRGLSLPPGWVVDREGRPSTETRAFYEGGSLLFAGGHKGYALSLFACLAALLTGHFVPEEWRVGGVLLTVIDPRAFLPLETYQERVRAFLDGVRTVRRAPGSGEILYPGEPEARTRAERLAAGIDVPETTWAEIRAAAARLGVELAEEA